MYELKKIVSAFIFFANCLLPTANCFCQTNIYHPFPDSSADWFIQYGGFECECFDRDYFMGGDTIVNSLVYHKIGFVGWLSFFNQTTGQCYYPFLPYSNPYAGAIRQDTAQKKVYFLQPNDSTDVLMYDFSLNIGDALPIGIGNNGADTIVSIDSILIGNNYRKKFNLKPIQNDYVIEGIGRTNSIFQGINTNFECGGNLYCFAQNNQRLYPDSSSHCQLALGPVGLNTIKQRNDVSIYPNSFSTSFTLQINSPQINFDFYLFDIFGREVKQIRNIQSKEIIVQRDNLPCGIYFYKLLSGEKIIGRGKIIAE